jgi:hypothetical protein
MFGLRIWTLMRVYICFQTERPRFIEAKSVYGDSWETSSGHSGGVLCEKSGAYQLFILTHDSLDFRYSTQAVTGLQCVEQITEAEQILATC